MRVAWQTSDGDAQCNRFVEGEPSPKRLLGSEAISTELCAEFRDQPFVIRFINGRSLGAASRPNRCLSPYELRRSIE